MSASFMCHRTVLTSAHMVMLLSSTVFVYLVFCMPTVSGLNADNQSASQATLRSPELTITKCFDEKAYPPHRTDSLSLRLPFEGGGRTLKNVRVVGDDFDSLSVNVSTCNSGYLTLKARRAGGRYEVHNYIVNLDWGADRNSTSILFYWSFYRRTNCTIKGSVKRHGLILISDGPGKSGSIGLRSNVTLYIEAITGLRLKSVDGVVHEFTKVDQWYRLDKLALNLQENIKVNFNSDGSINDDTYTYPVMNDIDKAADSSLLSCTQIDNVVTQGSIENSKRQKIWLFVSLIAALVLMVGIGVAMFTSQDRRCSSEPPRLIRVALSAASDGLAQNCVGRLRRTLSKDSNIKNHVIFHVTDLTDLRKRSGEFDLVLLVLGDPTMQLPIEAQNLMQLERWRFRAFYLAEAASPGPHHPLIQNGECESQGISVSGGEVGSVEELFGLAKDACKEVIAVWERRSHEKRGVGKQDERSWKEDE